MAIFGCPTYFIYLLATPLAVGQGSLALLHRGISIYIVACNKNADAEACLELCWFALANS